MKDYKVQQVLYNKLNFHDDFIGESETNFDHDEIISEAVAYFYYPQEKLVFPAKSYSVAIIYSLLIEQYFKTPFYESLDDPNLMCGNDKYFVPYSSSKSIYDEVINRIGPFKGNFVLDERLEQVAKTICYFKLEFGLLLPL